MTEFSQDQLSVLNRIIARHKKMHLVITPFAIGLGMRANGHDLPRADIKAWLAEHEADPVPEDHYRTPEPTKPEGVVAPGVDQKGAEKEMTTNGNATQKNWMDIDDENSSAGYIKFQSGDRKILKIVTNPIAGPLDFKQPDGSMKTNFGLQIDVMEGDNPEIKSWKVTSKSVRDQLKGICRHEGMGPNLAGSILRVMANGDGLKRTYFVELLQKPGQAATAPSFTPATTGPAINPAWQAAEAGAASLPDQGQAWIERERASAVAAQGAPAGGH